MRSVVNTEEKCLLYEAVSKDNLGVSREERQYDADVAPCVGLG